MGVLARVPLHCFPPRLSAGSPLTSLLVHRAAVRRLLEPAAAMADGQQHGVATAAAPASVREEKQAARKAIKAALKGLTKDIMYAESAKITEHVLGAPFFSSAQTLGVYVHCERLKEVDTSQVLASALAAGKRCYVPVVEDKESNMKLLHLDDMADLRPVPPFDILEPVAHYRDGSAREDVLSPAQGSQPRLLDLLLMPGLGFDTSGRRLGRGGGYYDKTLGRLRGMAQAVGRPGPLLVALAYEAQMVPSIPVDGHDEPVDVIVTAQGVVCCSSWGAAAMGK